MAGKFPAYSASVGASVRSTAALATEAAASMSPQGKAVYQQALDMMAASDRAVIVREMSHADYMEAYRSAQPFQERYERSRLERFENGRF